ncbi:hypothetical protein HY989_02740 [Candidatus Micrarchaeota archaeon]|nr:hypothetical protein [Candidatus Micrarchaeota archaeon]
MKKAQTAMESILLVAGAIFFVAIVAMSTRSLIVGGGESVDTKGITVASIKATEFIGTPTPLEVVVFKPSVSPPPPATATPTPIPPSITVPQCKVEGNAAWLSCDAANVSYGTRLQGIRVACFDQEETQVTVRFTLKNIAADGEIAMGMDDAPQVVYVNDTATFVPDASGGYFVLTLGTGAGAGVQLLDSNIYRLTTTCTDETALTATDNREWTLPYGTLSAVHFEPATSYTLKTGQTFNFSEVLTCNGGECFDIKAYLDPIFGNPSTFGEAYVSILDETKLAARFRMGPFPGMLTNITARIRNWGDRKYYSAIYADNLGEPGNKIGDALTYSDTWGQPADNGITQTVFNFSSELLQPNQFYWLAISVDGPNQGVRVYYDLVANSFSNITSGLPPASSSWGPAIIQTDKKYQLFATYKDAKTIVPFGKGFPFYTTTPNPITCSGMKGGSTCIVNWTVVANSTPETWDFFVIYDSPSNLVPNINGTHVPVTIRIEPYCALDRRVATLCTCGLFEQSTGYCCTGGNSTLGCTLNFPIRNKNDDVMYNTTNGTIYSTAGGSNTTIMFGNQSNARYSAALLFTNVSIPSGYAIVNATLRMFSASSPTGIFVRLNITGQATDNASMISPSENMLLRPRTTAYAPWSISTAWSNGLIYNASNIGPVINEIITRPGFAEGNSILLFIDDNRSTGIGNNYRELSAYELTSAPYRLNLTVFIQ